MHMGSSRSKPFFYTMVVSVVLSLLGTAVMKFSSGGPVVRPDATTTDQTLKSLEKVASPDMQRLLQRERAAQKANRDAAEDLPR